MSEKLSDEQRVVVTGLGAITPVGISMPSSWEAIKNGEHGIKRIENTYLASDSEILSSEAKVIAAAPEIFQDQFPLLAEARLPFNRWHRSAALGFIAMFESLSDAGLIEQGSLKIDESKIDRFRIGFYMGTTFGGADELEKIIGPAAKRARPGNLFRYLPARVATAPSMQLNLGGPGGMIAEECASGGSASRLGMKELQPYWGQNPMPMPWLLAGLMAKFRRPI